MTQAPPNAVKIWTHGQSLFIEVSNYVIRYPFTSAGLTAALGAIRTHATDTTDRTPGPDPRCEAAKATLHALGLAPVAQRHSRR